MDPSGLSRMALCAFAGAWALTLFYNDLDPYTTLTSTLVGHVTIATFLVAMTTFVCVKLFCPWVTKDVGDVFKIVKIMRDQTKNASRGVWMVDRFESTVRLYPDHTFVIFEGVKYSYEQMAAQANMVANVAMGWNVGEGECVALYMYNSPQFVYVLFGLQKLGIPVCLLNSNLQHTALEHCINSCNIKVIVSGADRTLTANLAALPSLTIPVYTCGPTDIHPDSEPDGHPDGGSRFTDLTHLMAHAPEDEVGPEYRKHLKRDTVFCYIFTSGTTGLPKPAIVDQVRATAVAAIPTLAGMCKSDVTYVCLPMYHSSGLYFGLFASIACGSSLVLRKKFSASRFWDDCRANDVTFFLYIGELCRYLLAQPKKDTDGEHIVRVAFGNGLRPDIWQEFRSRFQLPLVFEFFSSTEGTAFFFNQYNQPGAVGRYSPIMHFVDKGPKFFARYDEDTGKPLRDSRGRCIPVRRGEPGLLMAAFHPIQTPGRMYHGSPSKNEAKLERNVVKDGDLYFNFGDLIYRDKDYFMYFSDRLGDTFRWQGENVSTQEVSNVLSQLDFVTEVCVYGVNIPGRDGRAGMAVICLKNTQCQPSVDQPESLQPLSSSQLSTNEADSAETKLSRSTSQQLLSTEETNSMQGQSSPTQLFDDQVHYTTSQSSPTQHSNDLPNTHRQLSPSQLVAIQDQCHTSLPNYARPLFLRVASEMPHTSTYKQQKFTLVREGFNPHLVTNGLYYFHKQTQEYKTLTSQVYGCITNGDIVM